MNLNLRAQSEHSYDAIVVGSGISGGWAAKELTERGLKTLLLERGRDVKHIRDYDTAFKHPWQFEHRLYNSESDRTVNPVQSGAYDEGSKHFFVNDSEHPYVQERPFAWIRGYQVGGRSLTWGRQCYRLSDLDFEANLKEGVGVDWPIRYSDIEPWYNYVEKFIGLSGRKENLLHLPDGEFLPEIPLNCVEDFFAKHIASKYSDRLVTPARVANLTVAHDGRGPCQYRNLCARGCPFGGYFSSNSSTLPAAMRTGNLTLRPHSIVQEVIFDPLSQKAKGVRVVDALDGTSVEYFAKVIFLNASTIATAAILLNSKSTSFPTGLGNTSGQVGHNLMDHFVMAGAEGEVEGFLGETYFGRSPGSFYVPRFRNVNDATQRTDFTRGYAYQGKAMREVWESRVLTTPGFGSHYKEKIATHGPWRIWMGGWGETLPYFDNAVSLDKEKKDKWGMPLVRIHFQYHENEQAMKEDIRQSAEEMLASAGLKKINGFNYDKPPGSAVHEMGTARMGRDAATSVLNQYNQMHDVKNVFITDGSCMTSSATQNPSLTYMALTARACNFAVDAVRKSEI